MTVSELRQLSQGESGVSLQDGRSEVQRIWDPWYKDTDPSYTEKKLYLGSSPLGALGWQEMKEQTASHAQLRAQCIELEEHKQRLDAWCM